MPGMRMTADPATFARPRRRLQARATRISARWIKSIVLLSAAAEFEAGRRLSVPIGRGNAASLRDGIAGRGEARLDESVYPRRCGTSGWRGSLLQRRRLGRKLHGFGGALRRPPGGDRLDCPFGIRLCPDPRICCDLCQSRGGTRTFDLHRPVMRRQICPSRLPKH